MKVLIIGLDGATWNVFDDFMLEQHMPNLWKLKKNGCSGILHSTEPPSTAVAWTTCITGCQPQTHGIIRWHRYFTEKDMLQLCTSRSCLVPNMWQELSNQGYKIASINVPWTYPCQAVNGIMVAGFGNPGPKSQFTYPISFKDELLKQIPDYDIMAVWDKSVEYHLNQLEKNLARVDRSIQQRLEAAKLVTQKINWDVMMIQFQDTDLIEHMVWCYLDKHTRDKYVPQRDRIFATFKKLDEVIGGLLDLTSSEELMVVVVSDHGQCRKAGDVKPNMLLCQWGYLKPKGVFARRIQRWRRKLTCINGKDEAVEAIGLKQPKDFDFDWPRSKAMVIQNTVNGHVYINVKGRQPHGIVNPGSEYEDIIQSLRQKFSGVVKPDTSEPLFSRVATPEELYGISEADRGRFGDLIIMPSAGYELRLSRDKDGNYAKTQPEPIFRGTHNYEGIFIFSGTNVKASGYTHTQAHLADVAPTVYAGLGAKLPSYMDGRVLEEIFVNKRPIVYQQGRIQVSDQAGDQQTLSAQEEDEITKRLSALGYVE